MGSICITNLQSEVTPNNHSIILSRKPKEQRKNNRGTYFNSKSKELQKRYEMLKKHQTTR